MSTDGVIVVAGESSQIKTNHDPDKIPKKNIYQMPPNRLMNMESEESISNVISSELKTYHEVTKLLREKSTKLEEVAGFVISTVERARNICQILSEKLIMKPFLLDVQIGFLTTALDQLNYKEEENSNLRNDLYDVIARIRNNLDNIYTMFSKTIYNASTPFNKELVCDQFIKPLSDFLLSAKEWSAAYQVSTSSYLPCNSIQR